MALNAVQSQYFSRNIEVGGGWLEVLFTAHRGFVH